MPSATLPSPSLYPSVEPICDDAEGQGQGEAALVFGQMRSAISAHLEKPASPDLWQKFLAARRAAALVIAHFPRKEFHSIQTTTGRELVREVCASGVHDRKLATEDLALAKSLARKGWPGLLAAMLLTPAWQWPDAPLLLTVPNWLLSDYVAWLFASPQGFHAEGDADVFAGHTLQRLEELIRWMNRRPGAGLEAEVLGVYASQASAIPLYFCQGHLRLHAELRGRLLTRALVLPGEPAELPAAPRGDRRLRVGIVNRHFGSQTETYTTLPSFEHLDPTRFEVILFSHQLGTSTLETYCGQRASDHFVFPSDLDGQLSMLRAAGLDVVVFGTNVTAVCNEVTRLALHRVAPLQVVNNSSCITSGLPAVDLYVSGTLTESPGAAAHFSERLGLLPGPAHAFNYEVDRQEPRQTCTRADFGLPDDALVFVSAANYFKIIPEMQHAWARLLSAVPGSRLLLHPFNPNWSSNYPIARFRAEFDRVLQAHGVDASRLAVSSKRFPSRTDVKTLLGLGDVYLDTFPFGGVNSLVDPLELALPVVAWEGEPFRSRMGAALLRTLELPELIATTESEYQAIAIKLATEPASRDALRARIRLKMERAPIFLDSLAASDAFGDLIEAAYDELAAVGRDAFRSNSTPLRAARPEATGTWLAGTAAQAREVLRGTPSNAAARHVLGRALLESGDYDRAATYLLAALQGNENNVRIWIDLAGALRAQGQTNQAIEALEAGLRIDDSQRDGWLMLAELAEAVGAADLARDAAGIAQKLVNGGACPAPRS